MNKQLITGREAKEKLIKGAGVLKDAVVTTLGPKGRNVSLGRSPLTPKVVHDGVTVAENITLPDPFENQGAMLVKEAAKKTNDNCGDGTTTATLLAYSIAEAGMQKVLNGANPMILKRGIEKAVEAVVEELKKMAKEVKNKEEIEHVATISAADPVIGKLVAEAMDKVGKDGVVQVEEGKGFGVEIEYKEGMEFDRGYLSPYFINDKDEPECEIVDPYILITDKRISSFDELQPFLERVITVSKNLVILVDDMTGAALAGMVINKLQGNFNCVVVRSPAMGDRRKDYLQDVAILTGGTAITEETGIKLENVEIGQLGRAEKVWSDKDFTRIIGGKGSKSALNKRIDQIRQEIKKSLSEFDKEKLQERLAKLVSGIALINVGAATEVELKEKKERVIDAVASTKSAMAEGIVVGGGIALYRTGRILGLLDVTEEEQEGVNLINKILDNPLKKIIENAGEDVSEIMHQLKINGEPNWGYNVETGLCENLIKAGVIDPVKVTRSALQNAASVAAMILTTEVIIDDIPEEKKDDQKSG